MKYAKDVVTIGVLLIILYCVFFILIPSSKLAEQTYNKIDSLNNHVDSLETINHKLDSQLVIYNTQITEIDKSIDRIKNEKITIKEIYHEKINNVDNFDVRQLDSFFTERYYPNN